MSVHALVLFVFVFISSGSLQAGLLLSDAFVYSDGPLVNVSSGKWVTHSGTTGQVDVASGRVFLTQSESEDVNASLPTNSTGVFYVSLKINVTNLPTGGISYFAHFKDSGTANFRGKIFVTTNNAAPGFYRVAVANALSTSVSTNIAVDLSPNTSQSIVIRYDNNGPLSTTLWLNPAAETDPGVTAADSGSGISVTAFGLRQNSNIGNLFIDDLLVGTTFADVAGIPNPPEITTQPADQTATEGGLASFSVVANGSGTLNYQWRFNGTNLPGATEATLNLVNVSTNQAGQYVVVVSNDIGSTNSVPATLTVNPAVVGALSVLTYNTKGNGVTDWSTNSAQVQAIGRQVAYLKPDVITFQEIPYTNTYQMTNFVKAFLPGYNLATNSGTDNFIRSVIASRYPIVRSSKWLDGADLNPWGYTNANFTRDLFEAQISVPNFEHPVHIFTTHLKSSSGGYADAAAKRAAEAAAITNFFATNFFVLYPNDPYTLSGDFNESDTNTLALQRLFNPFTGLQLVNPANPVTGSINTYSIQASLSQRIDYMGPCQLLATNILSSQVFRSDKVSPLPGNLFSTDSVTASDHLPVLMIFKNPYNTPFQIRSFTLSNQQVTMNWRSGSNRQYQVEGSSNLTNWITVSGTILANSTNSSFTTNVADSLKFFRVYRTP